MTETTTLTPLQQTVRLGTALWNDSSAPDELEYAIANGAVGATSNPPITLEVLKKEPERWKARARELFASFPTWSETRITWQIYEEIALRGAAMLRPIFERTGGAAGRLSIQTDPTLFRDSEAMLEQGLHFVPQALAVAEAIERALERRAAEGMDNSIFHPVCTIMVGRLDDWMKAIAERDDIVLTPGTADWAGVAAFKRAYGLYRERGYRTRLLAAAYRNHLHWSQLVGGDVVLTMTHQWQVRFNGSRVEVRSRIDEPVDPAIVAELSELIPDFRLANEPDGMTPEQFDSYGATVRTLRQFIGAYHDLQATIRDFVLPNPDKKG